MTMTRKGLEKLISLLCICFHVPSSAFVPQSINRGFPANRLTQGLIRLGSTPTPTPIPTRNKEALGINVEQLQELNNCQSSTMAKRILESSLKGSNDDPRKDCLYGSLIIPEGASRRRVSEADLAIETRFRNDKYKLLDLIETNGDSDSDRAALGLFCVMVASMFSALVANQSMPGPEILRFIVVWALSFAPFVFVGYGIATPDKLQSVLISIQRNYFPAYRKRTLQHEAGHFLMAHLLGLPVKKYQANAIKNAVEFFPLNDPERGRELIGLLGFTPPQTAESFQEEEQFAAPRSARYFSEDGRGSQLMTKSVFRNETAEAMKSYSRVSLKNDPTKSWPFRGFDESTLDKLAVISVAGVCAELLAFGNAQGGYADLQQLRQFFVSAQNEMDQREMDNRVRFAISYTICFLRLHIDSLDALAAAMETDGSIADCVLAIESCAGTAGTTRDSAFEQKRRDSFRDGAGFLEGLLLGEKRVDADEQWFEKWKLPLVGDDPVYAAIAVATIFYAWASNGGLSLH